MVEESRLAMWRKIVKLRIGDRLDGGCIMR